MNRALFLDRDGIFNELVFYDGQLHSPRNWEEVKHYPLLDSLPDIKNLGLKLILVTNQPDIERGIVDVTFSDSLNAFYRNKYNLDAVYCCPFQADSHPWKKPNPGMFLQAAQDHQLDLTHSYHLGDTAKDVEAARRAGCKSLLWDRPYNQDVRPDLRVHGLAEIQSLFATSGKPS